MTLASVPGKVAGNLLNSPRGSGAAAGAGGAIAAPPSVPPPGSSSNRTWRRPRPASQSLRRTRWGHRTIMGKLAHQKRGKPRRRTVSRRTIRLKADGCRIASQPAALDECRTPNRPEPALERLDERRVASRPPQLPGVSSVGILGACPVDRNPLDGARIAWRSSSVAEQGTHKPLVGGSNPPSATIPIPLDELATALERRRPRARDSRRRLHRPRRLRRPRLDGAAARCRAAGGDRRTRVAPDGGSPRPRAPRRTARTTPPS